MHPGWDSGLPGDNRASSIICMARSQRISPRNCRYAGDLLEEGRLRAAVEGGLESAAFVELVAALCRELKRLNNMQETVNKPAGACV